MEEATKQRLTNPGVWSRALFMVLFAIAYSIAETIMFFLVVFQFLSVWLTGSANEPLLRFGTNLSKYVYQILQFETFNTETRPFPLSDWPDDPMGGGSWLDSGPSVEPDDGDVEMRDEPDVVTEPKPPARDEPETPTRSESAGSPRTPQSMRQLRNS
jgi:hypothetical protein